MKDVVSRYVELLCHEINNPLTIVYGQVALLKAQVERSATDPVVMKDRLGRLDENTVRVVALVRELREALRSVPDEVRELVPLTELLGQARVFNERWCRVKGFKLHLAPETEGPLVCVRPVRVRGILWQLIGRLLESASVEVRARLEDDALCVTIGRLGAPADADDLAGLETWVAALAQDHVTLRAWAGGAETGFELRFPRVD